MTITKKISSKPFRSVQHLTNKPSTITRAAITAQIKPTRGKQLVEHDPRTLIPDPDNPRLDEYINDQWLKDHLLIGTEDSLCCFSKIDNEYIIPSFSELNLEKDDIKDDYEFLRSLAFSIRTDGIIEPIEIFLADRNNDPEYFKNIDQDYGYVVLEGHQRRLAAIMAGAESVTCVEITDETSLSRLKVKHRKLRRQLSENNLRKNLSVGQNYKIVKSLLNTSDGSVISVKELSSIIGLNEDISGSLKRLVLKEHFYPKEMIDLIESSKVSFKWIRLWISKQPNQIEAEINRISSGKVITKKISVKPRGRKGGAIKCSALFKVNREDDANILQNYLVKQIPKLKPEYTDNTFYNLEKLLNDLMNLARMNLSDQGRI